MMKIGLLVGLALTSAGTGALAQAPATMQPTATRAPQMTTPDPADPAPPPPLPQTKTPDVVVTGGTPVPNRPCSEKDVPCMTAVAAQAWKLYPKKVDAFCVREEWRADSERMSVEAIVGDQRASNFDASMPPAMKILCDYPKTKH